MTISLKNLAERWKREPGFRDGYDALAEEFARASQAIEVGSRAHDVQAERSARNRKSHRP